MNTKIEYLYRDALNYKIYENVIIRGILELESLEPFLYEKEWFIPSVVGLKDLQPQPLTINDHVWHELCFLKPSKESPTCNISADKLKLHFQMAKNMNWNLSHVFKETGML